MTKTMMISKKECQDQSFRRAVEQMKASITDSLDEEEALGVNDDAIADMLNEVLSMDRSARKNQLVSMIIDVADRSNSMAEYTYALLGVISYIWVFRSKTN
jgi:hypothetical protein